MRLELPPQDPLTVAFRASVDHTRNRMTAGPPPRVVSKIHFKPWAIHPIRFGATYEFAIPVAAGMTV